MARRSAVMAPVCCANSEASVADVDDGSDHRRPTDAFWCMEDGVQPDAYWRCVGCNRGKYSHDHDQEKTDGSLAFLGSLPVTGWEHAVARVLLVVVATLPMVSYVTILLGRVEVIDGTRAIGLGLSLGGVVIILSLLGIGWQYRYSVERFMSQGMWTFLGIMAVGYVIEKMSWSGSLLVMILSPRGIVIFSLIG